MHSCYFRALRLGGVLTSPQAVPSGLQMIPPSLLGTENPGIPSSPDFILILICIRIYHARCQFTFYSNTLYLRPIQLAQSLWLHPTSWLAKMNVQLAGQVNICCWNTSISKTKMHTILIDIIQNAFKIKLEWDIQIIHSKFYKIDQLLFELY